VLLCQCANFIVSAPESCVGARTTLLHFQNVQVLLVGELVLFYADTFGNLLFFLAESEISFARECNDCRTSPFMFEQHGRAPSVLELINAALLWGSRLASALRLDVISSALVTDV